MIFRIVVSKFYNLFYVVALTIFTNVVFAQQPVFPHPFAPTDDFVKPQEKPFRDAVSLNGTWRFLPVYDKQKLQLNMITSPQLPGNSGWENTSIKVPSTWNINNFATDDKSGGDFVTFPSYPKSWQTAKAGWLMRKITYRKEWKGKRIILHFDAIGGFTQVYINKHKVGENMEVFLPFEVDVTNQLKEDEDNELLVWLADAQLFNQPGKYGRRIYVAGSFWGQQALGIWQDVTLEAKPLISVQNTFVKPSLTTDELVVEATLVNNTGRVHEINIKGSISPWLNLAGKDVISAPEPKWALGSSVMELPETAVKIAPNSETVVSFKVKVKGKLKEWDTEHPNLYGLIMTLKDGNSEIDHQYTRFGWRQFSINGKQVLLNGKPIVFKGDSWHFMGIPQLTRRYAWAWYTLLKDVHANAVRLHAQPYPQFYIDMADEMGICVLDETGMWASDGGPKVDAEAYWKSSEEHLKRFIMRDRNHPSVLGWSVCNENLPVVMGVFHAPDSLVKRQVAEINKWIAITRKLDPTRTWISADGETQADLSSSVIIGHYGGSDENYKNLSSKAKPWGIGEAGMAYYSTPQQTSLYNGDRAFESQQGRMEGVAYEATKLINMFKKYHASYQSVFNMVWYGIKPLEIGLKDTTRAPVPSDGVFFGKYVEDRAGIQPERLGPYTTTLNPGYDPALPLYKSWPLLDAVRKSFGDTAIIHQIAFVPLSIPATAQPDPLHTVLLLSSDKDSVLQKTLTDIGILVKNTLSKGDHPTLIIDGLHTPGNARSLALKKAVLSQGGNVLVWGVSPSSVKVINQYLPAAMELTDRKATSFITTGIDPLINGLGNSDFYFSELTDKPIMNYGLSGPLLKQTSVLLEACNTDWKKWNKRAEYLKTAAILRSERESKPSGRALIEFSEEKGKVYILTIDPQLLASTSINLTRRLMINLGINFNNKNNDRPALGTDGKLTSALLLASFDISSKGDAEIAKTDFLKDAKPMDYFGGRQVQGRFWEKTTVADGIFDFSKLNFAGPRNNAIAYLSFWVYSPRSLSNLLLEPDMPRFDMYVNADDGYQVFMNNILIKENIQANDDFNLRGQAIKALSLEKGWNHFVIKTIQKGGKWKLSVAFDSDKKSFLSDIKTQIAH